MQIVHVSTWLYIHFVDGRLRTTSFLLLYRVYSEVSVEAWGVINEVKTEHREKHEKEQQVECLINKTGESQYHYGKGREHMISVVNDANRRSIFVVKEASEHYCEIETFY